MNKLIELESIIFKKRFVLFGLILLFTALRYAESTCEDLWKIDGFRMFFRWCTNDDNLPQSITHAILWGFFCYFIFVVLYIIVSKYKRRIVELSIIKKILLFITVLLVAFLTLLIQAGVFTTSSFPQGTYVLTPRGSQLIEVIKVGDEIVSFDTVRQEINISKVERIFTRKVTDFIQINNQLKTTDKHPFAVVSHRNGNEIIWRNADELKVGDCLVVTEGDCKSIHSIEGVRYKDSVQVFNMQVSGNQNYFVNSGGKYVLVHNKQYGSIDVPTVNSSE